jgi:hypothetical protein
MKSKNLYQEQRRKRSFLNGITAELPTKNNAKHSALETGKDLLIGVVGGGLAGAAIGKPSLLVGLIVTGLGHYADNRLATTFGLGLMASSGFTKSVGINGTGVEGVKERVMAFKDSMMEKTYLDKIIKPKSKETSVKGLGQVQYFSYPNATKELEFSSLSNIENSISNSGMSYSTQVNGTTIELDNSIIY